MLLFGYAILGLVLVLIIKFRWLLFCIPIYFLVKLISRGIFDLSFLYTDSILITLCIITMTIELYNYIKNEDKDDISFLKRLKQIWYSSSSFVLIFLIYISISYLVRSIFGISFMDYDKMFMVIYAIRPWISFILIIIMLTISRSLCYKSLYENSVSILKNTKIENTAVLFITYSIGYYFRFNILPLVSLNWNNINYNKLITIFINNKNTLIRLNLLKVDFYSLLIEINNIIPTVSIKSNTTEIPMLAYINYCVHHNNDFTMLKDNTNSLKETIHGRKRFFNVKESIKESMNSGISKSVTKYSADPNKLKYEGAYNANMRHRAKKFLGSLGFRSKGTNIFTIDKVPWKFIPVKAIEVRYMEPKYPLLFPGQIIITAIPDRSNTHNLITGLNRDYIKVELNAHHNERNFSSKGYLHNLDAGEETVNSYPRVYNPYKWLPLPFPVPRDSILISGGEFLDINHETNKARIYVTGFTWTNYRNVN